MSNPILKENEKKADPNRPYQLFLILILLILSNDVLQMLTGRINIIKSRARDSESNKNNYGVLPAENNSFKKKFRDPDEKTKI